MEKTRLLINLHKDNFPQFLYYLQILDQIEDNILGMPDVAIESCKALIEGVSKTILMNAGIGFTEKGRSADSPGGLMKKVLDLLTGYTNIDNVFCQTACALALRISEIRNERGDISHGKSVPKITSSDAQLAEMVAHITDGIIYYILMIIFNSEWSFTKDFSYEDHIEFNRYLDEEIPLNGVKYSRALFDQELITYKEKLKEYLDQTEGGLK